MSQVKKLLFGEKIPKAQEGYKFNLDGQDVYYSDDDLKEIADGIAALPVEYRRFFGNAIEGIKSGTGNGNRASNTVSKNQVSNLSDKEIEKLAKQKPSYWSSLTKDNRYYFNEATNEYLNILHKVANKPKKEEATPDKTKIAWKDRTLDFNGEGKKKYLSLTGNFEVKRHVSDLIKHIQDGDNSEYEYDSKYDTKSISDWLNGLEGDDKYKAGNDFFTTLWSDMEKPGYQYNADTEDLLKLFGINYGLSSVSAGASPKPKVEQKEPETDPLLGTIVKIDGKDYKIVGTADGKPTIYKSVEDGTIINNSEDNIEEPANPNLWTLITPTMAKNNGWGEEYNFGLTKNGDKVTVDEILERSDLLPIMEYVEKINNQNMPQSERHKLISEKINIPSINNYADWTSGKTIKGVDLDDYFSTLGITSAAITDRTHANENGISLQYFNNGERGDNPWGFRSPYILRFDKAGNLFLEASKDQANDWGRATNDSLGMHPYKKPTFIDNVRWIPEEVNIEYWPDESSHLLNYGDFRNIRNRGTASLLHVADYNNARVMRDINGKYYVLQPGMYKNSYLINEISEEFLKDILSGKNISKKDWNRNLKTYHPESNETMVYRAAKKQGGKINQDKVKALVAKHGAKIVKDQNPAGPIPTFDELLAQGLSHDQIAELLAQYQGNNTQLDPYANVINSGVGRSEMGQEIQRIAEEEAKKAQAVNTTQVSKQNDVSGLKDLSIGTFNYDIPSKLKYFSPAISAGRYLQTAIAQKKDLDYATKALNAGRFNELATWANAPTTENAYLDRQMQQINRERMAGIKPVTSNAIDNYAMWNQNNQQYLARENDVLGKQSAYYSDIKKQQLDIMNRNLAEQVAVRNRNIERQKAIDVAVGNLKREYNQRLDASRQNASLEVQNNVKSDIDYLNKLNLFNYQNKLNDAYDKAIDSLFVGARSAWNSLGYDKQAQYGDFDTFLQKHDDYKDIYAKNKAQIDLWDRQRQERLLQWNVDNKLNYGYPGWSLGSTSIVGLPFKRKKGGKVNGHTRYTLEPDERIWIDNNKASHNAVAKLSDQIIKIFLKTLK